VDAADMLPRFNIHDLRHTHATHLLQEGWPIATVSRRLGHANPAITLSIYAHAITDMHGDDMQMPAAFAFTGTD
jgi:integrase